MSDPWLNWSQLIIHLEILIWEGTKLMTLSYEVRNMIEADIWRDWIMKRVVPKFKLILVEMHWCVLMWMHDDDTFINLLHLRCCIRAHNCDCTAINFKTTKIWHNLLYNPCFLNVNCKWISYIYDGNVMTIKRSCTKSLHLIRNFDL